MGLANIFHSSPPAGQAESSTGDSVTRPLPPSDNDRDTDTTQCRMGLSQATALSVGRAFDKGNFIPRSVYVPSHRVRFDDTCRVSSVTKTYDDARSKVNWKGSSSIDLSLPFPNTYNQKQPVDDVRLVALSNAQAQSGSNDVADMQRSVFPLLLKEASFDKNAIPSDPNSS